MTYFTHKTSKKSSALRILTDTAAPPLLIIVMRNVFPFRLVQGCIVFSA